MKNLSKPLSGRFAGALVLIFCSLSVQAFAHGAESEETAFSAKITRTSGKSQLKGFSWTKSTFPVRVVKSSQTLAQEIRLEGTFNNSAGDSLMISNQKISPTTEGRFQVTIPLSGEKTVFDVVRISVRRELDSQTYSAEIQEWKDYQKFISESVTAKRFQFTGGLGLTFLSFQDNFEPGFKETAFTGKGGVSTRISASWDVGLSGYLTLLPITHSTSETARFLGLNLRAGYTFPKPILSGRLSLHGGAYYTTSFVSNDRFGFKNMSGPQIFPSFTKEFSGGRTAMVYFKLSPVSSDFSFLSLTSRELAGGAAYSQPGPGGKPLSLSLDLASLKMSLADGYQMSAMTLTLGVGTRF